MNSGPPPLLTLQFVNAHTIPCYRLDYSHHRMYKKIRTTFYWIFLNLPAWIHINEEYIEAINKSLFYLLTCILKKAWKKSKLLYYKSRLHCIDINANNCRKILVSKKEVALFQNVGMKEVSRTINKNLPVVFHFKGFKGNIHYLWVPDLCSRDTKGNCQHFVSLQYINGRYLSQLIK